jgi:predicted glycosyltransferase
MKIIFGLGHPAHFHLYKELFKNLESDSYKIVITDKDVIKKLLDNENLSYEIIGNSKQNKIAKLFFSTVKLFKIAKQFKPDIFIGCLSQLFWVSKIYRKKGFFNAEDDFKYTFIQGLITYPFVTKILTPGSVDVGFFKYKQVKYESFHKLAYLHPNRFTPNFEIVKKAVGENPFVIIRLVNLNAYHDIKAKGISEKVLDELISKISAKFAVYITSEKPLSEKYKAYQLSINPSDIHHFLAFSQFFIGDSQSMTVESAMLGIPNIKFNSFAGRISVLEELEHKYKLTIGINPVDEEKLFQTVNDFLGNKHLKEEYRLSREKLLNDKIDVSAFFAWFYSNYPASAKIMKENPDYQFNFN